MDEIRAVPPNGYRVVSLFTGAGGSCCGFAMAGFRTLWASEFVPAARDTYTANWPDTILDGRDIRQVQPEEILDAVGLRAGEVDVLEGSPPCASFSMAGKRHKEPYIQASEPSGVAELIRPTPVAVPTHRQGLARLSDVTDLPRAGIAQGVDRNRALVITHLCAAFLSVPP
jgi:site-specific DNA-cytosine methylase